MSVEGLLLINLGSPASTDAGDVRRYLNEFLTDRYVIDLPAVLRYPLVYGLISRFRYKKTAAAYAKIWRPEGSPLLHETGLFAERVRKRLQPKREVRWAMRYGTPSIASVLKGWNVDHLYIVPLYPQYAESSSRTAIEMALQFAGGIKNISILRDFFREAEFIEAQASQIASAEKNFHPDKILLSFHGLPEHHMRKLHPSHCLARDHCSATLTAANRLCYRAQAFATAQSLRTALGYSSEKMPLSFQSRLGRRPWIKPYTEHVVAKLARDGCKRLLVSCPSFVADCLETLEEVQIRLREQFLREGGEDLRLVPAVNAEANWVEGFCKMVLNPNLPWLDANAFRSGGAS